MHFEENEEKKKPRERDREDNWKKKYDGALEFVQRHLEKPDLLKHTCL